MLDIFSKYCWSAGASGPAAVASMITIYIEEAHPIDGWYLPGAKTPITHRQPQSTEERISVAKTFVQQTGFCVPLYVDTIANEASLRYSAWPERLYIVQDGVVVFQGGPGPFEYRLTEVLAWLESRFGPRVAPANFLEKYAPDSATCALRPAKKAVA
jgi:hypothetical protein